MAEQKSDSTVNVNDHFLAGNADERETLGINLQRPKFPQYAVVSKRLDSFKAWPEYLPLKPDAFVEAGLVYTGIGDSVRCYHCGGGLRNWEEGDVPFEEHAKWYPTCPHVLLVKGQSYVDALLKGEKPGQNDTSAPAPPVEQSVVDLINTVAAQSCLQMGFSEHLLKKAIQSYQGLYKNSNFSGTQLCEIMFEMEEMEENMEPEAKIKTTGSSAEPSETNDFKQTHPGNLPTIVQDFINTSESEDLNNDLKAENKILKEKTLCKICLTEIRRIVFLPCGHLVCCVKCGPVVEKCFICNKTVHNFETASFDGLDK